MAKLLCPNCGRTDQVQKLTAIVSEGTTTGTANTVGAGIVLGHSGIAVGGARTWSRERNVLSQRLACPPKPSTGAMTGILVLFAVVGISWGLVGWAFPSTWARENAKLQAERDKAEASGFAQHREVTPMTPGNLLIAATIAAALAGAMLRHENQAMARWVKVADFWWRAYYCHRCDGVFARDDEDLLTPEAALKA